MNSRKVSIIIPAYNVENYIEQCINSIVKQTYKNIQIIIVDDGSTDNTLKVCRNFKKKDKRIEVYHHNNSGLGASRNLGITKASGDYLMFVDSDDYIDSSMVEKLLSVSVNKKAQIVMCNNYMFDQYNHISWHKEQDKINNPEIWTRNKFWYQLYTGNWGLCTVAWNKLYATELFKNIKYRKNKLNEDDFIITELMHKVDSIYVIPDRLYYYRINRQNSIMANDKSSDSKYLDGVESQLVRFQVAEDNNEFKLMTYCYKAIPGLMVKQYGCRHCSRFLNYKRQYRRVYDEMNRKRLLNLKFHLLFLGFYYCTPIFHFAYMLKNE